MRHIDVDEMTYEELMDIYEQCEDDTQIMLHGTGGFGGKWQMRLSTFMRTFMDDGSTLKVSDN